MLFSNPIHNPEAKTVLIDTSSTDLTWPRLLKVVP